MHVQISTTIPNMNQSRICDIIDINLSSQLDDTTELGNLSIDHTQLWEPYLCGMANMPWRTVVAVKQMQSNQQGITYSGNGLSTIRRQAITETIGDLSSIRSLGKGICEI